MVFDKHLAEKISHKIEQRYDRVTKWMWCKFSFIIMNSALLCLGGSWSINVNSESVNDFSIACDFIFQILRACEPALVFGFCFAVASP